MFGASPDADCDESRIRAEVALRTTQAPSVTPLRNGVNTAANQSRGTAGPSADFERSKRGRQRAAPLRIRRRPASGHRLEPMAEVVPGDGPPEVDPGDTGPAVVEPRPQAGVDDLVPEVVGPGEVVDRVQVARRAACV